MDILGCCCLQVVHALVTFRMFPVENLAEGVGMSSLKLTFLWKKQTHFEEKYLKTFSKKLGEMVFVCFSLFVFVLIVGQRPHQDLPISFFNGIYAIKYVFSSSCPKPENGLLSSFHLKVLKLKTFKTTPFFFAFFKRKKKRIKNLVFLGYWQGRCHLHISLFPLHDHSPEEKPYQINTLCYGKQAPLFLIVSLLYYFKII